MLAVLGHPLTVCVSHPEGLAQDPTPSMRHSASDSAITSPIGEKTRRPSISSLFKTAVDQLNWALAEQILITQQVTPEARNGALPTALFWGRKARDLVDLILAIKNGISAEEAAKLLPEATHYQPHFELLLKIGHGHFTTELLTCAAQKAKNLEQITLLEKEGTIDWTNPAAAMRRQDLQTKDNAHPLFQ